MKKFSNLIFQRVKFSLLTAGFTVSSERLVFLHYAIKHNNVQHQVVFFCKKFLPSASSKEAEVYHLFETIL